MKIIRINTSNDSNNVRNVIGRINFIQTNRFITNTILDEMQRIDTKTYGKEKIIDVERYAQEIILEMNKNNM